MRQLLNIPALYTLFQSVVRGHRFYSVYVRDYIKPGTNCRILDIGCGPGDLLAHLPHDVNYTAIDANQRYINAARRKYQGRGTFICHPVKGQQPIEEHAFDVAVATGVLHHLDDEEARQLFRLASLCLKPGGRLITVDGCRAPGQNWFTRFLLAIDRGRFIRNQASYRRLADECFTQVDASLRHDMFACPYTCLAMVCRA